ncbi:putative GTP cyclohydrolase-2 [Drechslerella stenobrocha 248]|uniref:GTP cyclohydrolase II n=1 Tax=Drechslerella stenobrocha 248 TaxID=1043628 RepID=W7HRG3_9PEZI|nr:putative GTP cyclohydrolase-2 [Drechslerella stenobrocha 248]
MAPTLEPTLEPTAGALESPSPTRPFSSGSAFEESPSSTSSHVEVPPCLLSPAFTPPSTPGSGTPKTSAAEAGVIPAHEEDLYPQPSLLDELPEVECQVRARIPMNTGGSEFFLYLYRNNIDNKEHLAIVFGDTIRSRSLDAPRPGETEMDRMTRGAYVGRLYPGRTTSRPDQQLSSAANHERPTSHVPLVRIHSECYTGETAWSARCDCGEQLDEAARLMAAEGHGAVVYLRQEGRGIGLAEKLKAYNLQDLGNDTVTANLLLRHPADARSYGLATAILLDLGLSTVRLLTNNPIKVAAVEGPKKEITVQERVPMIPLAWKGLKGGINGPEINEYLKTKISRMGHMMSAPQ